ncbi:MAG: HAD family hydrolase [Flavobacteriales bacterium]
MFPAGIKNVIFDFGGVLFDIDYHLPVRAFHQLGFDRFAEIYSQAAQHHVFDELETGKISNEDFLNYLKEQTPNASREQIHSAWNCILLNLWPNEVELVRAVRASGIRTFLFSNTNAIHVEEFEKMIDRTMTLDAFRSAFEQIYYSNVVGIKKPYPETFLQVCKWNQLNPSETLFIDDSIQHVRGAEEAGLKTYHLKPGERVSAVFGAGFQ